VVWRWYVTKAPGTGALPTIEDSRSIREHQAAMAEVQWPHLVAPSGTVI
jgi:hypothetical protein